MSRKIKMLVLSTIDSVLIILANLFSYFYMLPLVTVTKKTLIIAVIIQLILYLVFGGIFKIFVRINRYASFKELVSISSTLVLGYILEAGYFFVRGEEYSQRFVIFTYIISLLLICLSRIVWRLLIETINSKKQGPIKQKRTLIIGAGDGGAILLNALNAPHPHNHLNIVGIVDDAKDKVGTLFVGKKVLGTTEDLTKLIKDYDIEQVTVAIPSMKSVGYERIVDLLANTQVKITVMPSLEQLANGDVSVTKLREIDVVDLLGREEVQLDMNSMTNHLTNRVILVTGAGGSIGSEICRQVMRFKPKRLLLLGHGENSIYLINQELRRKYSHLETEIIPIIADVQDRERIFSIMEEYKPELVYHAAAHKHVPLMEYNPSEAVKNNIYGTKNVAEAAKFYSVDSFVMISTDKATNPPNVMGATKRIAEMIVTGLNEEGYTKFSAVRFGNVLGSRGSVVPLFKKQIDAGGPVTVTDFRMTRYFMTIPEASRLVIQSGALSKGGEIFILDMGEPVKIVDLAKQMIKLSGFTEQEIPIIEAGIRPGEKLYEELLVDKEMANEQVYEKIFVGNITGFGMNRVNKFLRELPLDRDKISKEVVAFANASTNEE